MRLPEKRFLNTGQGKIARSDAVTVGKLAALATVFAAALTLFSGALSTGQLREQNCIARIDSQEAKLRDKAALLQGNLAEMIAVAAVPTADPDRTKYHFAVQKVMRSGYELTAYTGTTKLGLQALRVADAARRGLTITTAKEREQVIQENGQIFYDWPLYFSEILDDYERRRKGCAVSLISQFISWPAQTPAVPSP